MRRQPQEVKVRPGAIKSAAASLPAPVGGLNARDSVANMNQADAVLLDNFFPLTTSVEVRKGFTEWATFDGVCQAIIPYNGNATTEVFAGVVDGSDYYLYDVTSAGAVSAEVVGGSGPTVQALSSARFDYANFGTTGGQFLSVVNGANSMLQYDGATWTVSTAAGVTTANLFTVGVYSTRLWYAEKDSMNAWYQQTGAITGALTKYHLGTVFKLGGYLNSIITVTDSANTRADYIVFLSSEGELVAYSGDPASTFTRVAQFRIGRPVAEGNRTWVKWGADALVLCADGVFPISRAIASNSRDSELAVSDKVRNLINGDLAIHGTKNGWGICVHPTGAKLIVNVPTTEDVSSKQYVMNTQNRAWCTYSGWDAFCFETAKDTLWMGCDGYTAKADTSTSDEGADITANARQAFNYFGKRGSAKQVKMIKPLLASDGDFEIGVAVDVDYKDSATLSTQSVSGGSGDPWGGIWDASWSGGVSQYSEWKKVSGIGYAIAPRIRAIVNGSTLTWAASSVLYEGAGLVSSW